MLEDVRTTAAGNKVCYKSLIGLPCPMLTKILDRLHALQSIHAFLRLTIMMCWTPDEVSGSQGAASDAETSDHDAESSDADMADPVQDSMSSPRPGHKPARSRNTAIQDSDDE